VWVDNETARDFLNFSSVADTVAEVIIQAKGRPTSIGVSGAWGVGKSSLIKLTQASLSNRTPSAEEREFIFVEFNAWLYQGYDDARAALMDVIADKLQAEAKKRKTAIEKVAGIVKRVRWLRSVKLVAGDAAALALGLAPTGLLGKAIDLGKELHNGVNQNELEEAKKIGKEAGKTVDGLIAPEPQC
jgi:predicted KAP-like P-loop ATPase